MRRHQAPSPAAIRASSSVGTQLRTVNGGSVIRKAMSATATPAQPTARSGVSPRVGAPSGCLVERSASSQRSVVRLGHAAPSAASAATAGPRRRRLISRFHSTTTNTSMVASSTTSPWMIVVR